MIHLKTYSQLGCFVETFYLWSMSKLVLSKLNLGSELNLKI